MLDTVLYNGKIRTLDKENHIFSMIGIKDGKIEVLSVNEDIESIEAKQKIDLNGKLVLPGFVDTHLHMVNYAFVEKSVKLFDCRSVEEMLECAGRGILESEKSGIVPAFLYCRGFNEEHFTVSRYPQKKELDEISVDIPMIMVRVCGHVAVCNSCALELLKTLKNFSEIESEVDFETGLIKEHAVQFFYSVLPAPSLEEVKEYIRFGMKKMNEHGFTGIHSDDLASLPGKDWRTILNAYQELDEENEMTLRVYEQCLFERLEEGKAFIEEGYRTGQKGKKFTIGSMKLLQDGSLGAHTAALNAPYEGEEENRGIAIYSQEELDDIIAFFDQHQMQAAVHCIGDRAMDMVLQAIEHSTYSFENPKGRHGIVHAQITNPAILQKMKELDVLVYIQPVFVDLDMNIVEQNVGAHRMDKVYAWKTMLDMGIHAVGGSDAPVVSFHPLENIYFAVTRQTIHGNPEEGWIPSEKMSVDEAVKLFTKYAAYASFSEDELGTIEIGKKADLVVLDRDLYEVPKAEIKDAKVEMTLVNGRIVYGK